VSLLDRFRHIERSRSERSEDAAQPSAETAGRFEGVERPIAPPAAPAAPAASGAELDRFGPEPPPRIELAEPPSRRAMGEELARQVGALERRRLEAGERGAARFGSVSVADLLRTRGLGLVLRVLALLGLAAFLVGGLLRPGRRAGWIVAALVLAILVGGPRRRRWW
jgi:hypothetical protein